MLMLIYTAYRIVHMDTVLMCILHYAPGIIFITRYDSTLYIGIDMVVNT